jgi:hypothetical protein
MAFKIVDIECIRREHDGWPVGARMIFRDESALERTLHTALKYPLSEDQRRQVKEWQREQLRTA